MKAKEIKIEKHLARHEVAALLRAIADAVEHGDHESLARLGMDPHEAKKLKIDLRQDGIHLDLRLKIKDGHKGEASVAGKSTASQPNVDTRLPAYKDLKKRMKTDFTALVASRQGDRLPPAARVAAFLADAELMVSCQGHGDEYYDAFSHACQALRKATHDADAQACHDALAAISERMRECHKRYKH